MKREQILLPLLLLALHTTPILTSDSAKRKLASVQGTPGCNLNLCFVLDGSVGVSPAQYILEKHFVFDILSALAGNKLEVSGVQYGDHASPIHALTNDSTRFIVALDASHARGGRGALLRAVDWCYNQLLGRFGEAGKIVVLGGVDGGTGFAEGRVRKIGRDGFEMCGIGVGKKFSKDLLVLAGGRDRLLDVDDFFELADLVDEVVERVCGTPLLR